MIYTKEIQETGAFDVVVCGGGPAGCAAALSARREGLSVLLIESTGQLGGMAVSGHVSHWLGGRTQEGEWVVGGIFKDLATKACAEGCALIPKLDPAVEYHPYGWFNWFIHGVPMDPFKMSLFLDSEMEKAGVEVFLFTRFVDVEVVDGAISRVIVDAAGGLRAIPVKAVIDATGNADVAYASGCSVFKGRKEDGKLAPSSLIFHVYGVDTDALTAAVVKGRDPKFRDLISKLREEGIWNFPYDIFICTQLTEKDEYFVNTVRLVGVDGTDAGSLSDGMRRGRKEVYELMEILKKYFPGFGNTRIKSIAPLLGIRETRRIQGDYTMTVEDLMNSRSFEDNIGFSMYGWDLPDPDRPSVQPFANDSKAGFKARIKKNLYTPLPYRIMVPDAVSNLLCAGRIVSVEGQVLGPVRVMAPCMAMGEAAGAACSQAISESKPFRDVDTDRLRSRLVEYGCIVDEEQLPPIYPRVDQV